jgi:hypothetical protein
VGQRNILKKNFFELNKMRIQLNQNLLDTIEAAEPIFRKEERSIIQASILGNWKKKKSKKRRAS